MVSFVDFLLLPAMAGRDFFSACFVGALQIPVSSMGSVLS